MIAKVVKNVLGKQLSPNQLLTGQISTCGSKWLLLILARSLPNLHSMETSIYMYLVFTENNTP